MDIALSHARKALRLDPKLPMPFQVIGNIYMRKGKRKEAIQVLKQAVFLEPNDKGTKLTLSGAYLKLKDYDQAIKYSKAALDLDPNLPGANFNLAMSYYQKEDPLTAIQHIELAEKQYVEIEDTQWAAKSRRAKSQIMKKFNIDPSELKDNSPPEK